MAMLARKADDYPTERRGMGALVEQMTAAVFFVERSGQIVYANAAGEQLLVDGSVFHHGERNLVPIDEAARRLLEQALSSRGAAPFTTMVATPQGRRTFSIMPPMDGGERCGVVMLTTPDPELSRAVPHLARAYGLTAAETGVLTALLKRRTLTQIAGELGVTLRTVKAHLQKLFEKTGTRRQSDLVGEVLSLIPPVRFI